MDRYIKDEYKPILALLRTGTENGIHLKELCSITGLKDRDLRKTIEAMRRDGYVIISGNKGYCLPADENELNSYTRREESRAKSTFHTLQAARKLQREFQAGASGQLTL